MQAENEAALPWIKSFVVDMLPGHRCSYFQAQPGATALTWLQKHFSHQGMQPSILQTGGLHVCLSLTLA